MSAVRTDAVAGLILAGGQARRMGGGDKCLLPLGGRSLLSHIVARLAPQVGPLALNANGDPARFSAYDLPVVEDAVAGQLGPLAGVLTGLLWAQSLRPAVRWLVTVPGDGPLLPDDLVARLLAGAEAAGTELACAVSGERRHPVIALWPLALTEDLRAALVAEGLRKVDRWTDRHGLAQVTWPNAPYDPFFNINRPEDLTAAQALLGAAS
ncbi:MAG: molybdenum cofactor guanylyltransferase MobA [Rhodospirillales bacterium]